MDTAAHQRAVEDLFPGSVLRRDLHADLHGLEQQPKNCIHTEMAVAGLFSHDVASIGWIDVGLHFTARVTLLHQSCDRLTQITQPTDKNTFSRHDLAQPKNVWIISIRNAARGVSRP
ncbi:hypothetical protein [Cognatishimia sp. F0-27]|uniref:hypothetical protein n=1 Tax=Cognatishimia sp. F0-27 TaxID=2816855 RepID=UPI001D0C4EA3|nr:hypothetical protein [Cognatishimia sp. F0-27]MCC1493481.1 hypothetical protein [Cognatishimia sp. F0-27]